MANSKRLKCRFCNWETNIWHRKKGGKPKHVGFYRLRVHMINTHPEKAEEIARFASNGETEELDYMD